MFQYFKNKSIPHVTTYLVWAFAPQSPYPGAQRGSNAKELFLKAISAAAAKAQAAARNDRLIWDLWPKAGEICQILKQKWLHIRENHEQQMMIHIVIHHELDSCLVVTGAMEFDDFPLGMSSSQLIHIFQRGWLKQATKSHVMGKHCSGNFRTQNGGCLLYRQYFVGIFPYKALTWASKKTNGTPM